MVSSQALFSGQLWEAMTGFQMSPTKCCIHKQRFLGWWSSCLGMMAHVRMRIFHLLCSLSLFLLWSTPSPGSTTSTSLLQGLPQLQKQENYLALEAGKSHCSWSTSGLSQAFISDALFSEALRKQLMKIWELALWVLHKNSTSSISLNPHGKGSPEDSIMRGESEQCPAPGCSRAAWSHSDKDGTKE